MKVLSIMLLMSVATTQYVSNAKAIELSKLDLAKCYEQLAAFSTDLKDAFFLKNIAEHIRTLGELKAAGLLNRSQESLASKLIELYMQKLDKLVNHDVSQEHLQTFLDELKKVGIQIAEIVSNVTQEVKEDVKSASETAKLAAQEAVEGSKGVAAQAIGAAKEAAKKIMS